MPTPDDPQPAPAGRRPLGRGPGAGPPRPAPAESETPAPRHERDGATVDEPGTPAPAAEPGYAVTGAVGGPPDGVELAAGEVPADGGPDSGATSSPAEPAAVRGPGEDPRPGDGAPEADSDAARATAGPGTADAATGDTSSDEWTGPDGGPGARETEGAPSDMRIPEDRGAAEAGPGPVTPGAAPDGAAPDDGAGAAEPETVDDGRFTVVLDNFEGPFDLLLQLISKHKLDVTEVALSRVTDEFMAYIHAMGPDWDLDQTTEFLVVAATLLDLKAARLLPAAEVEDEADLALLEARDLLFARLLQYRAYKQVADIFAGRLAAEAHRHPRTVGLEPHHAELLPEVVISIGPEGFARLAVKAMQPKAKPQVYVEHIHAPLVSVQQQAEVVVARLRERGEVSFQELTEDAPDTLTVVARFLALLELYRERAVTLDQEEALGAIVVRWSGGEDTRQLVTDEFDRAPEPGAQREQETQA